MQNALELAAHRTIQPFNRKAQKEAIAALLEALKKIEAALKQLERIT